MQEEVENRAVTLVISATKLTARLLKAVILKYLASRKEKKLAKARGAPEKPTGKQTVKQLVGQNQGVSNIEVTERNIKGFDRVARKYGVDYAIKKDKTGEIPRYLVFFKARMVPGAASSGLVAPMRVRILATAERPETTILTTGPLVIKSQRPPKKGLSARWA